MQINLPPELEAYIRREVESGAYQSADDLVAVALHKLREEDAAWDAWIAENREELRRMVKVGLDQLDRGEYAEFNAEDIKAEGRRRLAEKRKAEQKARR